MDGHGRYADEPEPSWYSGQSPYEAANAYDSGVHDRPSGAFRLPEQRPADGYLPPAPYATPDPLTTSGSHALPPPDGVRSSVRGPEYPTIRPTGTSLADAPSPAAAPYVTGPAPAVPPPGFVPSGTGAGAEPTGVVPPISGSARGAGADRVYRTRRPLFAILVAIVGLLLMVPVVLLLIQVTFVDDPAVRGIVPAVLLTLGLPLAAIGLYSLAAGGGPAGRDVWLRPPVAYLPVGLLLLLAAALAVA